MDGPLLVAASDLRHQIQAVLMETPAPFAAAMAEFDAFMPHVDEMPETRLASAKATDGERPTSKEKAGPGG